MFAIINTFNNGSPLLKNDISKLVEITDVAFTFRAVVYPELSDKITQNNQFI